ncbi:MAG: GNAT family N-acetyltransferase [Nitrospirae bacterium]|nr:GNAT family N-acetyltransferase [Nitrospirota bacterium]
MVKRLLDEIIQRTGVKSFDFNVNDAEPKAKELIDKSIYHIFLARDTELETKNETEHETEVGLITLCESYSLYANGSYGLIQEFYVSPDYRSRGIGRMLLEKAKTFGASSGWKRMEVTTPPLPEFKRSLNFYQKYGFSRQGGYKLKVLLGL